MLGSCSSETTTTASITADTSIGTDGSVDATDDATVTVDGADEWAGRSSSTSAARPRTSRTCAADEANELGDPVNVNQDTVFPITSDNAEITEAGDYCFGAAFSGDSDAGVPESEDAWHERVLHDHPG